MTLQNRVDPFGAIHAVAARGMFTGNRGVIHDPDSRTLLGRRWSTRAWIVCDCGFQGRKREVFGRNAPSGNAGWTNLFFLDEVTALAAGHRPCFFCRREKARKFADGFARTSGLARVKAAEIDARLHAERLASGGHAMPLDTLVGLPEGTMIASGEAAYALRAGRWLRWGFSGYAAPGRPAHARLLTPPATLAVLAGGYAPAWHPSAVSE